MHGTVEGMAWHGTQARENKAEGGGGGQQAAGGGGGGLGRQRAEVTLCQLK